MVLIYAILLLFASIKFSQCSTAAAGDILQSKDFLPHKNVSKPCPPWYVLGNDSSTCKCDVKKFKGILMCDKVEVKVLDCYCATYDKSSSGMVVGSCFYNCESKSQFFHDALYHKTDVCMCEKTYNRSGLLCGKCKAEMFPLMYSFNMTCIQCDSDAMNWVLFSLVATIPSTLFVILVLSLRVDATSSFLHGFILYSQAISVPTIMRFIINAVNKQHISNIATRSIAAFYGICNLDYFRSSLPPMCVRLTTLQALSLDYVVAVYPLLLISLSYFIVHLYHKRCGVVVFLSHPLRKLFSKFQKTWNVKSSLVNAYVTFFIFSYMKFLSTSFDLLMPTSIHYEHGNISMAAYYDASVKYFSHEHLPIAVTALIVFALFTVFPTLLILLYPFYYFRIVFKKLSLNTDFLNLFVEHLYRCYNDGSEPNTADCRWFASLFLMLRIFLMLIYALTLSSVFFPLAVLILLIFVMILISVKPYKKIYKNNIKYDAIFLLLLSLFYLSITSLDVSSLKDHRLVHFNLWMTFIFGTLPLLYVGTITIFWIIAKRKYAPLLIKMLLQKWKLRNQHIEDNGDVPDRLINPTDYSNQSGSIETHGSENSSNELMYS